MNSFVFSVEKQFYEAGKEPAWSGSIFNFLRKGLSLGKLSIDFQADSRRRELDVFEAEMLSFKTFRAIMGSLMVSPNSTSKGIEADGAEVTRATAAGVAAARYITAERLGKTSRAEFLVEGAFLASLGDYGR